MVYVMVSKRLVENALFLLGACKKLLNDAQNKEGQLKEINKLPSGIYMSAAKIALTTALIKLNKKLDAECGGSEIITLH